ncbi:MAG: DUF3276 family protein [Bacteroidales bacterium]|jgi:hypothetical protein|nr:DUF3276 family protein [Bacteroidales bacterium]MDY0255186.1 DUF3276 family protein [Tenuifilaceae bacterium]
MMDELNNQDGLDRNERDDIFSKVIRAGKRTYFFDVKATRQNDYYLTITESKKRFGQDGKFFFEKHKIFLYKEDFEKFAEGLNEVVDYIKTNNGEAKEYQAPKQNEEEQVEVLQNELSNISFDDLDNN